MTVPRSPGDELYTDEEWHQPTHDPKPGPEREVAIRHELVGIIAAHRPDLLCEATLLLMWAELDLLSRSRA